MTKSTNYLNRLAKIQDHLNKPFINKSYLYREIKLLLDEAGFKQKKLVLSFRSIHRAVVHKDESWFDKIDKFGIPPAYIAGINRCNSPNRPIFYGSNDNTIPIFEVRANEKINQFVAVSRWCSKRNAPLDDTIPIEFNGFVLGNEQISRHLDQSKPAHKFLNQCNKFNESLPYNIKDLDRLIGELFVSSQSVINNIYWLTSAIVKVLFGYDCQGIIYPSVENKLQGYNIVFSESFFKRYLRLYGATIYQIKSFDPERLEYTLSAKKSLYGSNSAGKLVWKNIHSRHNDELFIFSPHTQVLNIHDIEPLTLED
ncbi:hypothetical protein LX87_04127 [Larkinella arboricola]|uniref:RES domain-containing protein n=1 Tax=Larkinella arboricola TaxID=643671 RepID=A0A327WSD4_LARAB|nr:hypothetical protein [Larkinella arboricola]RAJ94242.1 hypothetical protein LX87_04127 [Larkinella arboricola]